MKFNVGTPDRIIRAVAGAALIALSATSTVGIWGYIVGGILFATGVVKFCPAYAILGLSTRKAK